ncbi:mitofilin family membrane protein [uncultured Caulobacter sp.]|uniref:COG4223 family protein n=1 Tax=uncultured Caulobacter sp. TaxID=158749 RepID=UPI00262D31AB|nr:mitofilin family membrane protein [uncultured Caulobacter sp.]
MNAAPDPAEIVAPSDPALYARKRVMGPSVWVWLFLCLLCAVLGAGVAWFGPTLFPAKSSPTAPISAAPSPKPIAERLAPTPTPTVEASVAAPVAPAADVERLDGRVTALETTQKSVADAAAAALAVSTMAEAANSSRPFPEELAGLQRVLPGSPSLRALEPLARLGAPTRAGLAVQFGNLAGRAASAARNPGADADLFARIRYALSSIVSIRHVGSIKGSTPDAILARAQVLLDEGDIEGAVAALEALPDPAREVLAPWFAAANRRVEIDRHVASVRADALASLARITQAAP